MLKMTVRGVRKLNADLDAYDKKTQKALKTAIKIEGYRQLRILRDDIKHGRPGGQPYAAELSKLARRTKRGALKKNQIPLYRLSRLLRYNVDYTPEGLRMSFGFVNTNKSSLSGSWKKLLIQHQEGVDVLYSRSRTYLGRRFARIGGRLEKKGDPDAKFFFLRKTTGRRIDLPKREIIEPFWESHQAEAWRKIRDNFNRKMRGERI